MAVVMLLLVVLVAGGYFFSDRHHDLYHHQQGYYQNPYYAPQPHFPPQGGYERPGSGFGPLLFVIIMGIAAWLIFNSPDENTAEEGPKVNQVEYPDNSRENRRPPSKRINEAPKNTPNQEPRQFASPVLQ